MNNYYFLIKYNNIYNINYLTINLRMNINKSFQNQIGEEYIFEFIKTISPY